MSKREGDTMTQLTREETAEAENTAHKMLAESRAKILEHLHMNLAGRKIRVARELKNPDDGLWETRRLVATVRGVRWTTDDEIVMRIEFTNPHTGKIVESEEEMHGHDD